MADDDGAITEDELPILYNLIELQFSGNPLDEQARHEWRSTLIGIDFELACAVIESFHERPEQHDFVNRYRERRQQMALAPGTPGIKGGSPEWFAKQRAMIKAIRERK